MIKWLECYLKNRTFYVVANGYASDCYKIPSGVPQGSHLGPILFIAFINDMADCFTHSVPLLYADDLKFFRVVDTLNDSKGLQHDLDRVSEWCARNGMQLNVKKCTHIKIGRKHNVLPTTYFIDGMPLQRMEYVRDLGVIIDPKLTFLPHIENAIKISSKMLGFIMRNGKVFKNPKTKIMLYNAFVRSRLEYCSVVWRPHYATHSLRIERLQKRFVRHLAYTSGVARQLSSYEERLKHFRLLTLDQRRDFIDLVFLFKILNNKITSPKLLEHIKFNVPRRYPRSLIKPFAIPVRRTVLGQHSPICRICRLYNEKCAGVDIHSLTLPAFRRLVFDIVTS